MIDRVPLSPVASSMRDLLLAFWKFAPASSTSTAYVPLPARSGRNWTAASAKRWRSWWTTNSSMDAPVEGMGSCGREVRGSIAKYEMVIFPYRYVSGEAVAAVPAARLTMSSAGPCAVFLISSTEV